MKQNNLEQIRQVIQDALSQSEWTPSELMAMVMTTMDKLEKIPGGKEAVRLRDDRTVKYFMEEVYPLAFLTRHIYADRTDIKCKPIRGNQNYDAVITDNSVTPPLPQKVEITCADYDKQTYYGMMHLNRTGSSPITGHVDLVKGKDRSRTTVAKGEAYDYHEVVEEGIRRVVAAIKKKDAKKYEKGTWLVVSFHEFPAFRQPEDLERLRDTVEELVKNLMTQFGKVFLVSSHDTVLEFSP